MSRRTTLRRYHLTHQSLIFPIIASGLQARSAGGRLWLCTGNLRTKIREHVAARHGWPRDEVVTLAVEVPRSVLRRSKWSGCFFCRCTLWHVEPVGLTVSQRGYVDERPDLTPAKSVANPCTAMMPDNRQAPRRPGAALPELDRG